MEPNKTLTPEPPFSAYITNLGKYNEGELVGKWVQFPTTPDVIAETMQEIGIDGKQYEEFFITDYDCNVSGLYDIMGEYESLDELNYLAAQISEMPPYGLEKLEAILADCGVASVADAVNMTLDDNLDCYEYLPNVNNDEDLGYYWVEESGVYDLSEMGSLANYIDYEKFGRDIRINEGGVFAEHGGYISDTRGSVHELYAGVSDIPDEYLISGYEVKRDETERGRTNKLDVLMISPGEAPRRTEIDPSLRSMQDIVGGQIEAVYPFEDEVAIIANEEGKLLGLPLNRALFSQDGQVQDIIVGDFIVAGLGREDFASLSPELLEKYSEHFKDPEEFIKIDGKIAAVKVPVQEATIGNDAPKKSHDCGPEL